jgi:hypothetical protein
MILIQVYVPQCSSRSRCRCIERLNRVRTRCNPDDEDSKDKTSRKPPQQRTARQGIEIPTVKPRISGIILGINLAVYAVGIAIALGVSNEASNEFFLLLAKINSEVRASQLSSHHQ